MENLNPVLYGGDPLQDRTLATNAVPAAPVPDVVKVPLSDVLAGTDSFKQGAADRMLASQPKAEALDVIGAATSQWLTTGLFHYITDPTFAPDGSSASAQIQRSGMDLDNDEMDYLLKGKSAEDRQFRINRINALKQDARITSSRPLLAGIVAGLDPALLLTAAATGGIGELGNLGAVAKMGVGAAQASALVAATASSRPMSNTEAGLNIVLETLAAPLMGTRGTKKAVQADGKLAEVPLLVPHDPDFPAAELRAAIAGNPTPVEVKPFGAHATGDMGDIYVMPSAKAPGKFQLTYFADNIPVEDKLFATEAEAMQAFHTAVKEEGAAIVEKSWDDAAQASKMVSPDSMAPKLDVNVYSKLTTAKEALTTYLKGADDGLHKLGRTLLDSPFIGDVAHRVVAITDDIPSAVKAQMEKGAGAVTAAGENGVTIYMRSDLPNALRGDVLMHETVHALTIAAIARKPEFAEELLKLGSTMSQYLKRDAGFAHDAVKDRLAAFWSQIAAKDADEVLAYAITSPNYRKVAERLTLDGVDVVNAPVVRGAPKALTLWDKTVDLYNRLIGKKGSSNKSVFDYKMRQHQADALQYAAFMQKGTVASRLDEILGELLGDSAERGIKPPSKSYHADLEPGVAHEPAKVAAAVQKVLEKENKTWIQKVGSRLEWNIHKSMREFGPVGSKIADTLFDNNGNLKITSVESHIRGVSAQLKTSMGKFDNLLLDAMAEDGYGTLKQIWKNGEASAVQENIERQVNLEMLRRDQLGRQGRAISHEGIPPRITAMADALDKVAKQALDEMQAAGVSGVEELKHTSGWASRRWSSLKVQQAIDKIASMGYDVKKAKAMLVETVARSVADATPGLEWELAHDIAASTIDRALRKGALEDASFMVGQGMDNAKGIRDMLHAEGVSPERIQRIMDRVVGKADESGKASFLKHRIEMDYTASLNLGKDVINVTDLFDHNIKDIFDRYIDKAAAESGFARKGLKNASDIDKLRAEGIAALGGDPAKTKEFADLFDGTVAHMFGEAHGGDMGKAMRNMSAFNRLVSLGASGYWQLTEYAKMMQQYGALKTIKYAIQEMPMFKQTLETAAKDKQFSTHLKDILEFASSDNMRLQPFVRRFADGLEMPANATLSGKLQHATQLVPYLNGMKYVHSHQARVMANLTLDCINRAATGDAKMVAALEKYGVTAEHFKALKADVLAHGMDVGKWGDGNWANVRPAFMKMMDEGVLHARLGDTPAFALLNPVGKFICTYRGYTLTAHNKLLAGTMQRDGLVGVGLMMAYQYPLSALAVQAQATINNKKPLTAKELAMLSMTQMGSMGLLSEVGGVLTGGKKQVGSPGLIPVDRVYSAVGEIGKATQGKGSASRFAHDVFQLIPGLAVLAPAKSFEGYVNPQKQ